MSAKRAAERTTGVVMEGRDEILGPREEETRV